MIQLYCERCGGLFNTESPLRRFCDGCKAAKWREYNSEYQRKKRARARASDGTCDRIKRRIIEHEKAIENLKNRLNYIERTAA